MTSKGAAKTDAPCCPPFDSAPWDGVNHRWTRKLFIKDKVRQIFHIPVRMGVVVDRMWKKVQAAGAAPADSDFLLLAYDPSPWISELYMTVTRNVPDAEMAELTGEFFSKVYDGPYNHVPRWLAATDKILSQTGKKAIRHYFHFTTCPRCAKIYGHNYVIDFAQTAE